MVPSVMQDGSHRMQSLQSCDDARYCNVPIALQLTLIVHRFTRLEDMKVPLLGSRLRKVLLFLAR